MIDEKKLIRDLFYSSDGNRYRTKDCDNFPITISLEDLRKIIYNQPQVQPIVRSAEEIAESFTKYTLKGCKEDWINWLTKKEV